MKKRCLFIFIACCQLLLLSNCKKGDTGPAGATGPAGPVGPVGTANIIYSPWANITFTGSATTWKAKITAPGVTQDIMDKGLVKTYFKFGTDVYEGNYTNLSGGGNVSIYQYLALGSINLVSTFNASTYPWRYVIIPGGIPGGRLAGSTDPEMFLLQDGSAIKKADLDKMSYEEVCKRFNIPLQ
jgi:hypothetical protein